MNEPLPISIQICDNLQDQFIKIGSVCNKLEAQLNFQTMAANWYSDEADILFVKLHITSPDNFINELKNQQFDTIETYSDDVASVENKTDSTHLLHCFIAITESELTLITQQKKLLQGLLQVKLQKVLNLIASKMQLPLI